MRQLTSILTLLAAVLTALALLGAPAGATESGGASEPAASEPASEPAGEGTGDVGHEEESGGRAQLPLDLNDPQDLFGAVMLGMTAVALAIGAISMVKQLRGERPQADGSWRPR